MALSTWRRAGGLDSDDWVAAKYCPRRCAISYLVSLGLVNRGTQYRAVYLDRKEYEVKRAESAGLIVAPSSTIKGKKDKDRHISLGYIDMRARRYTTKRLLRDLWKAWGRASAVAPEKAMSRLPASTFPHKEAMAA
jgi:hypothetical protein